MTLETRSTLLLVLITAIWGATFPFMKEIVDRMPPMAFVAIRFLAAALINAAVMRLLFRRSLRFTRGEWSAGINLGMFLFIGYCSQAIGLQSTTASNAGFITGLSVVLVPIIFKLQGQPMSLFSWIGAVLSFAGVALLAVTDDLSINRGDLWVCLCALAFAFQIINVGSYSAKYSAVNLTVVQLLVCGGLSAIFSLVFENPLASTIVLTPYAWGSLGFCALVGTSFAYIIQTVMQKHTTAPRAALIFSFEPVFAVIFAYLLLGEVMSTRAWIGGGLMMAALLITDLGPWLMQKGRRT